MTPTHAGPQLILLNQPQHFDVVQSTPHAFVQSPMHLDSQVGADRAHVPGVQRLAKSSRYSAHTSSGLFASSSAFTREIASCEYLWCRTAPILNSL